jgi:hypothetical protein
MSSSSPVILPLIALIITLCVIHTQQQVFIWPKPTKVNSSGNKSAIIINFKTFNFNGGNVPSGEAQQILEAAIDRYTSTIFYNTNVPARGSSDLCSNSASYLCIGGVTFRFPSGGVKSGIELDLDMDERYTLTIKDGESLITVNCNTVWGALRALETIAQLVVIEEIDSSLYYVVSLDAPFTIIDQPRFKWRGMFYLMCDTSLYILIMTIFSL